MQLVCHCMYTGYIPEESITLRAGGLEFPTSMLEQLRKLGLVVEINNGTLVLREPFIVCRKGEALKPGDYMIGLAFLCLVIM